MTRNKGKDTAAAQRADPADSHSYGAAALGMLLLQPYFYYCNCTTSIVPAALSLMRPNFATGELHAMCTDERAPDGQYADGSAEGEQGVLQLLQVPAWICCAQTLHAQQLRARVRKTLHCTAHQGTQ